VRGSALQDFCDSLQVSLNNCLIEITPLFSNSLVRRPLKDVCPFLLISAVRVLSKFNPVLILLQHLESPFSVDCLGIQFFYCLPAMCRVEVFVTKTTQPASASFIATKRDLIEFNWSFP
jgi:hypothetical protein